MVVDVPDEVGGGSRVDGVQEERDLLAAFVEAHHPDAVASLAAVLEPFGRHLLKKYG